MNSTELPRPAKDTQKGTVGVQWKSSDPAQPRRRIGVNDTRFWEQRLRKRQFSQDGELREAGEWSLRLKEGGRSVWFPCHSANKAQAANLAREIGLFAKTNGLVAAEAKFKHASDAAQNGVTIGLYLGAVEAVGSLEPRTLLNYANCLRTLTAGVFGIKGGDAKFDYRAGGNQKWRERIDAICLERLTADRINRWAQDHIAKAGPAPAAGLSARRTVNSYIRCSRSLFSTRRKNGTASLLELVEKRLGTKLALPLPFQGVGLFEAGSMRYRSTVNVQALITAARQQLKADDVEAYKAFVLGLFAGMRRAEIDGLTWDMIDWTTRTIRLKETENMRLKTEGSADDIALDPEASEELRAMMSQSQSPFVIASERKPRGDSLRAYYRCDPVFNRLTAWLRSKGITSNKPLHELRKEIGAIIATEQGIYAASRFLRHSDITTTARHYADQKTRVTAGLGTMLTASDTPQVVKEAQA